MRIINERRLLRSIGSVRESGKFVFLSQELHGFRGVLALWVAILHVSPGSFGPGRFGYTAVDLFFIMSGFVLMGVHEREMRRFAWPSASQFIVLRVLRTFPTVLVSGLVGALTATLIFRQAPSGAEALRYVFLLQSWPITLIRHAGKLHHTGINGPIWSLRYEWLAYIAFPLMVPLAALCSKAARLVALIGIPVLEVLLLGNHAGSIAFPAAFWRSGLGFAEGCLLWTAMPLLSEPAKRWSDVIFVVAGLGFLAALFSGYPVLSLLFMPPLVLSVSLPGVLATYLLGNRVALFLGRISLAFYLLHIPCTNAISQIGGPLGWAGEKLAVYAVSVLLASASTFGIEEPVRRYGRAWLRRRSIERRSVSTA